MAWCQSITLTNVDFQDYNISNKIQSIFFLLKIEIFIEEQISFEISVLSRQRNAFV